MHTKEWMITQQWVVLGLQSPFLYVLTLYLCCILCSNADIEYVSLRVRSKEIRQKWRVEHGGEV